MSYQQNNINDKESNEYFQAVRRRDNSDEMRGGNNRRDGGNRYNQSRNNDNNYNGRDNNYNRRNDRRNRREPPQPTTEPEMFIKPDINYTMSKEEIDALLENIETFEELNLSDNIVRGIYSHGFEKPSIIQKKAIRPVLSGRDVIAQAQSGMGKTGAFCIGTIGRLDENVNATQAVIIAHTRELALQIDTVFRQIAKYTNLRFNLCIKGVPVQENIEKLMGTKGGKPHVIIGTPGRILDMLNRRDWDTGHYIINQSALRMLVIDEADEMLGSTNESFGRNHRNNDDRVENGFLDQIFKIFQCLPKDVQVCLFSATMSTEFFEITQKFMREPIKVLVKTEELTLTGIKQFKINVEEQKYKFDTLCELYGLLTINQSMIYCNSLKSVEYLTRMLRDNNFMVSSIHGQMTPIDREVTMADFRNGKSRVLISTDLLSRGIDVQQVSVVINYDIPLKIESYLHRIGRSGRYGRKGVGINFVTNYDEQRILNIERYYATQIDNLPADINNLL